MLTQPSPRLSRLRALAEVAVGSPVPAECAQMHASASPIEALLAAAARWRQARHQLAVGMPQVNYYFTEDRARELERAIDAAGLGR